MDIIQTISKVKIVNSFLFEENEENYSLLAIKNDPK